MALDLKLKINTSSDCKNLVIQDVTGAYNADSNPGGWGGFNINGNRQTFNLNLSLIVNHFINGKQYNTPISLSNFASTVYYPAEDTFRGFKVSIPSYDISTEIANVETIPEEYNPMQEVVEDTLYQLQVVMTDATGTYNQVFIFDFRSICNSEKAVNSLMGRVNLNCEDCDDSDIEKALLAKSLLEALKKIK
jgi:hypothetical protein